VFEIDREIVYTVQSQTVKNKIYEVAVEGNKIKHCTCQGWATHKKCKHAQQIKKNKLTVNLTPQEKAIERLAKLLHQKLVNTQPIKQQRRK